jgi:hypothetical protein
MPAWRVCGATLAAFAIGIQLLLSGLLIGRLAAAAQSSELSVICSHDSAPTGDESGDRTGGPSQPQHNQCPACACPQAASLLASAPDSPSFAVLRARTQVVQVYSGPVRADLDFHSPYASRAPPQSA